MYFIMMFLISRLSLCNNDDEQSLLKSAIILNCDEDRNAIHVYTSKSLLLFKLYFHFHINNKFVLATEDYYLLE